MKNVENKYVAFCDILGFSSSVLTDFEATKDIYIELKGLIKSILYKYKATVEVSIYSDSIVLVSKDLIPLLATAKTVCWLTLMKNWLIRGGIGYGKYWKEVDNDNLIVISEGLIEAVKIEKSVQHPIISISSKIKLDPLIWVPRFQDSLFNSLVLYHDDCMFVNPFNIFWFRSAKERIINLAMQHPSHKDKYDWLLRLINAVEKDEPLTPLKVLVELEKRKIIFKKKED